MVWGQGDGSGLRAVDTAVGRVGALACRNTTIRGPSRSWRSARRFTARSFPGPDGSGIFSRTTWEATIRHHALESGCFVIHSTGWLTDEQIMSITPDDKLRKALRGGCYTAIISPVVCAALRADHRGRGNRRARSRAGDET